MSRNVFYRDEEAQGFTTYGLLLDTLFRQLKTVGIAGYFPYEYHEDMSCEYAELVSFFGEEFGRLAEQEADANNLSILSKHVSLRGILLDRYRKDNERCLAARNSLSIGRLKRVEDKNEPSWAELVASAEDEDKKEEAKGAKESEEAEGAEGFEGTEEPEGAGIQDSDKGQQNSAAMNSFLAAIKSAHAVDDSVAPEYIEEDDEEPVSGYPSEEDWGEDEDPSVLPADEDEEEDSSVLPADDDEDEDPSVLPDDEDEEEYSSELPADEDEEEYSSELPADDDEEDSSVLPEDDDEDDEEYSSELPADEDDADEAGYSSELPSDDDEEDSSILPEDEDDEEYSSELPADEDADEDDDYSSELPEDDDEDYSSELPEDDDDDEDYSSELPDDDDSGVLPDDDDEPESFKSAPQPKAYTSPMMSYSAPVSSMVVRPSYARGIPGRETQEAVLDMMNKLANNIKGWFSRL